MSPHFVVHWCRRNAAETGKVHTEPRLPVRQGARHDRRTPWTARRAVFPFPSSPQDLPDDRPPRQRPRRRQPRPVPRRRPRPVAARGARGLRAPGHRPLRPRRAGDGCGGEHLHLLAGRHRSRPAPGPAAPGPPSRPAAAARPRRALRRTLRGILPPSRRESAGRPERPAAAAAAASVLARLGLRGRCLGHRHHQQPRYRQCRRDHRHLQRRHAAEGGTGGP